MMALAEQIAAWLLARGMECNDRTVALAAREIGRGA